MKEKYKIGEFAEKMGVSVGFLKHHEKFGLLEPYTSEAGHRFYTEDHAIQVCRCLSLQSMGFSVKETAAILNGTDDVDVRLLMEKQLRCMQLQHRRLEQSMHFLEQAISHNSEFEANNTWNIKSNFRHCYLEFSGAGSFVDRGSMPSTSNWTEYFPISVLAHRFELRDGQPVLLGTGFAIPADNALNQTGIDMSCAEKISFHRSLEYLTCKNMNGLEWGSHEYSDELLREPLEVCRKHNFKPTGRIVVVSAFSSEYETHRYIDAICVIEIEED